MMGAALNPDAGRNPAERLADQVEIALRRPSNPIRQMDRIDWALAIRSEMPWILPSDAKDAAVLLEDRYYEGIL